MFFLEVRGKETRLIKDEQLLKRITINPRAMVGKPVVRGTRLTVDYILNLLAHGATVDKVLEEYEGLTREHIQACLLPPSSLWKTLRSCR